MQVEILDAAITGTGLTEDQVRIEVAVALYRDRKVSMGRAALLAGLARIPFQRELAKRGITVDYEVEDLHADLATLRSLGMP